VIFEAHRHSRCGVIDARVKRRGSSFRETGNVDHEIQRDAERIGASSWPSTRFKQGKSGRSHQSSSQATKGRSFSVTSSRDLPLMRVKRSIDRLVHI
jgi:hypothetical protein